MKRFAWAVPLVAVAAPCAAETPRQLLTRASFGESDKAAALALVDAALAATRAGLRAHPGDAEARLTEAIAIGYRAKLTGSRGEAVAARRGYEALVARNPRDAEAQLALGAWHLGAVHRLGGLVARAALGAKAGEGQAALERAVALGGDRALFAGLAALLLLQADPGSARGRALAEAAARGSTPTANDRHLQHGCATVLAALRAGTRGRALKAVIDRALPLGRIPGMA